MITPSAIEAEEMVRFLASPVPRSIPPRLLKVALSEAAPRVVLVLALVFFAMGLVFASIFFPRRLVDQLRLDRAETREARGRIVSVEDTGISINKVRVRGYRFEFITPEGRRVDGECFTTGRRWSAGAQVTILYSVEDPSLACVRGARLGAIGAPGLLVVVFPVAGIAIAAWWIRARRRLIHLLTQGVLGDFYVKSIEPTNMRINKQQQFKVTLEPTTGAGSDVRTLRWHQPDRLEWVRLRQKNKQQVFGLFDPARPNQIVLPESWMQAGA